MLEMINNLIIMVSGMSCAKVCGDIKARKWNVRKSYCDVIWIAYFCPMIEILQLELTDWFNAVLVNVDITFLKFNSQRKMCPNSCSKFTPEGRYWLGSVSLFHKGFLSWHADKAHIISYHKPISILGPCRYSSNHRKSIYLNLDWGAELTHTATGEW